MSHPNARLTPLGSLLRAIRGASHNSGTSTCLANVDVEALKPRDLR